MSGERNPFVIPDEKPQPKKRGCNKCGAVDYGGMMTGGVALFTCRVCGNQWAGGIGMVPADPTVPTPPEDPRTKPIVDFELDRKKFGDVPQPYTTRRPDLTQDFRKGAPITGDDDV